MPRAERKKSNTGIYHVLLRGINKQRIFEEQKDYEKFLEILAEVKKISGCKIYAYCLLSNHVHLLIGEGAEPLARIFRRIGARYVFWFNWKYERNGHLFQDRFRSEPVETDEYLITALTYIHMNPVKAGICRRPEEYEWSSRKTLGNNEIVDGAELFGICSMDAIKKREKEACPEDLLEPGIGRRIAITDEAAFAAMKKVCGVKSATEFQQLDDGSKLHGFAELHRQGVSIRQFVRLTGLSKGVVERMNRLVK